MKAHNILEKSYPYKTELHAHSAPCSRCSHISPEELVEKYSHLGCDSLVITNHLNPETWTSGRPSERAEEYLSDFYTAKKAAAGTDLSVVLGVEIRFPENSNDYLIYGVCPEDIEKFIALIPMGIREFYKKVKSPRNVILQAHPFRKNMIPAPLDSIDGIETMNLHPGHNSNIGTAAKYARENGLLVSGGTDCHYPQHVGMCFLRTTEKISDSYDIAEVLKNKDFLFDLSGHFVLPCFEDEA